MKKYLYTATLLVSVLLPSCTQNPDEVIDNATITISVDEFVRDGAKTKTNVDPANNYAITWADGDAIGIFPREGYQEPFTIPASQVGQATVRFDGGYWEIKNGLTYNAYYPFSEDNFKGKDALTHIPVSYLGQSQNGRECNAGAYDYTYSDWSTAVDGKVNFAFHHLGSFVVINLSLPETGSYTGISLKSSSSNIPTKGSYDLTASKPAFVPDPSSMADHLDLELTNFQGVKDEVVTFYMMMSPVDLSGSELKVVLTSTGGNVNYSIESKNILASRLYEFTGRTSMEYVDLGLSVKWATCNLGATKPEDYGLYYQWGDTQGYGSDTSDGKYFNLRDLNEAITYKWHGGKNNPLIKYNTKSSYGTIDNKTVLDLEDDAAHVALGDKWRMPTDAEWTELRENCTWVWTMENGINGYKITSNQPGYTNESIFLPAAGYRSDKYHGCVGIGYYWSSSLYTATNNPLEAFFLYFESGGVNRSSFSRPLGLSIRPVYGEVVHVSSVSLNQTTITMDEGQSEPLAATVYPSNATNKSVNWKSSNNGVATVDANGKVMAIKAGTATITVTTVDGGKTATCTVTVASSKYVDLGLSVKWATCNLGATKPEGYGHYYAWGETSTKSVYNASTYRFYANGSTSSITKYNTLSARGSVDNKTQLDLQDDAAYIAYGSNWRMPTAAEWSELIDNCCWEIETVNGILGFRGTSLKAGYTSKSIFLPFAGDYDYRGTELQFIGEYASYLTSTLQADKPWDSVTVYIDKVTRPTPTVSDLERHTGQSIRPVYIGQ